VAAQRGGRREGEVTRPLADLRVIAIEQYGAGPFGSLQLADLGAEVIKIEDARAGGDIGRYVPPYQEEDESLFFETFNRNKKSVALDLSSATGKQVLHDLVKVADAVYSNLRGDIPAKLGIRYADLKHLNPKIVCCALTGYGMNGPRSAEPAYDYLLQGLGGWMSLTGEPDSPPAKTGISLVDYSGGYVAALSLLAGVHAAQRDGVGMDCDVSLFDVALSLLTYPATWHLTRGFEPVRSSSSAHPSLVPFQNFESADGWLVVACPKEKFWARLVDAIGRPDLGADPRFKDFAARREHAAEVLPELAATFRTQATEHWLEVLGAAAVPCAPVNSVEQALTDAQVGARQLIIETEHPRFGKVRHVASAARAGDEGPPARRGPRRNEDLEPVLRHLLGYTDEQVAEVAADAARAGISTRSSDGFRAE
jgi:crotonobetainyl-CoA:carnitine CoA-transferase CaiB-like acyl-CoA transferase